MEYVDKLSWPPGRDDELFCDLARTVMEFGDEFVDEEDEPDEPDCN